MPHLVDCPKVAGSAYPTYQADNWHGLMLLAKTPLELVTTLRIAVAATLATAAVSRRLNELAHIPVVDQPAEFGIFLRAKIASLAKVVKDLGLRAD